MLLVSYNLLIIQKNKFEAVRFKGFSFKAINFKGFRFKVLVLRFIV